MNTVKKCVKLVINKNYARMHSQQNIKGFWYLYDSVIIIGIVGRGDQRAEHGLLTIYRHNHPGILCIFKVFVFYRGKGFTIFE